MGPSNSGSISSILAEGQNSVDGSRLVDSTKPRFGIDGLYLR